ncbi:hypothetical protein HDU84_003454 [Entophlyctis sp. JEL0112]|nr:hypothetical protein HDU84_003454 [Entophlyctis sp. JEL0112]
MQFLSFQDLLGGILGKFTQPNGLQIGGLIVKWFGGILGKFTQPNGLQIGGLCSSESVIRAYLRDPLVHNLVSFRMGRDMFQHSEFLAKCAAQFKTPLIMYHSIKDTFTSPVASKKFFDAAGSVDKLFKGFKGEGLEHELHNEPRAWEGLVADYTAWILERSQ